MEQNKVKMLVCDGEFVFYLPHHLVGEFRTVHGEPITRVLVEVEVKTVPFTEEQVRAMLYNFLEEYYLKDHPGLVMENLFEREWEVFSKVVEKYSSLSKFEYSSFRSEVLVGKRPVKPKLEVVPKEKTKEAKEFKSTLSKVVPKEKEPLTWEDVLKQENLSYRKAREKIKKKFASFKGYFAWK